jgi:diaminopropionate ammonia-lyase
MTKSIEGSGAAVFVNPNAATKQEKYGQLRSQALNIKGFDAANQEITRWPNYAPTPLHRLPALAQSLGIAKLFYKDESTRFILKSFKALGGAYAVFRLIQQAITKQHPDHVASPEEVISGKFKNIVSQLTVTCATDGNHGRSVAWGAQTFGCRCVIYVHSMVSQGRADAISALGAEVIRVQGNYDNSVHHAAQQAACHGWTVVSDTTYEGYRDIPIDVMHGYGVMSREIVEQFGQAADQASSQAPSQAPSQASSQAPDQADDQIPPTHVIVQAGVGAFAASVCAVFWLMWGDKRPNFIVVEPDNAACLLASAQAGELVTIQGDLDTVMAGLACGEVSPVAWEILSTGVDAFTTVSDHYALEGMKILANPSKDDIAIVSGETGTTGLALLLAAKNDASLADALKLNSLSRVLILGSEGDTDPDIYYRVVGQTAQDVSLKEKNYA